MSTLEDVFINVSKLTKGKRKYSYDLGGNLIHDEFLEKKKTRTKLFNII